MTEWHEEHEPFPAYLRRLSAIELMVMRHGAIAYGDDVTKRACDVEFKRRERAPSPTPEEPR